MQRAPRRHLLAALLASSVLVGCGTDASDTERDVATPEVTPDAAIDIAPPTPGEDTIVDAFDASHLYYLVDDDRRARDATVVFPAAGAYEAITLTLTLACPDGGCEAFTRHGSLGVVLGDGTLVELAHFATPYKLGMTVAYDVTDLRPLLAGEVTLRAFVDTAVGPGSPFGAGWLLSASFDLEGGVPADLPVAVIPIYAERRVVYGDPAQPVADAAPPPTVTVPADATRFALRANVTGHGQGNVDNCAEFCRRTHTFTVGAVPTSAVVWRDCDTTAVPGQSGTYKLARAGWCAGAAVHPWIADVTGAVAGRSSITLAYGVEDYANTCRPDAPTCAECTLGAGCAYDGGAHVEPAFRVSAVLVAFL